MDTEESTGTLALRISLLKHALADLNELMQSLVNFSGGDLLDIPVDFSEKFFTPLAFVRELIIDKLKELNTPA